jgi:hypothetical protein
VQQRNGAKLPGGVGRPGDGYEQQADAAASAVERGESAEPILDRGVSSDSGGDSGGGSAPAVQHRLAVNAFRMYEPPALATHVALSTPRGGDQQERGGAVKQGPRQGTAQSGQSAIAQADQGASPVPATQAGGAAPAPAGGAEAQTSAPAGFNPHCYNADYDEPADDSGDEPQDDKKTTESKEEIHPDLPRPDETDNCPIETAISAQTPVAAAPAGQQVSASATPAAAGNTPAQAAAPAATPGPNAEAGAITAALHADGSKIQDNAHAAASAPSPLEGAIAQAEAGRDTAVSSFQDSGATTRVLAPRIGALSSDVRFLPETSDGAGGEGRAGETRISDFFGNAANRLDQALTFASDVAPDRLGDTAESMKGNIAAGIEQQKTSLSANIESARLQAFSSAESARADIHAEHRATTTAIEAQTSAAMDTLTAAHQDTIDSIQETETDALDGVNALYRTSYDAHVALGPEYADRADARGEQYAEFYQGCKRYNEDGTEWKDGFFAGYLTNRRAEAEVKAARETAKGYRKSLTETANDQAAQAMKGRRKDRCGIIATARRTRTSVDDHLTTLMGRLERGRQESIAQAGNTRDTMLAHINSGLNSALAVLDLLEHDGRQSLDDTGYLQQLAVEQAAYASASAVQESVAQAVGNVEAALANMRSTLAETPAPAPQESDGIFAQATTGLNSRIDLLAASTEGAVAGATARLEQAGTDALAALDSDAQTSFDRISAQNDGFSSQMDSLASGAAATFATLRTQYTEQAQQKSADGAERFMQAGVGFERACDTALEAIDTTLSESEERLGQEFEKQIGGLDSEQTGIPKQAAVAASKEQPAWKKIVAIVLIIVIIIVVALVIGPAIIGAVGAAAAALGASAGVATAVGAIVGGAIVGALSSGAITVVQNWSAGERLTRGLGHAMLVGAATGAIGGAIGLGVNAGLNAVLSGGGRLAMSAGAQFAVRAATNITSDTLLNVGQQMVMTGHIDWGELAQGVAMSLVLHGSRRIQAFQARVTAVGARGTARGISALGGAPEPSARASQFAGDMEHHATTAESESRKSLDWTRPTRIPVSPEVPKPPAAGGEPPTTPVKAPPVETAPAAPTQEAAPARTPAPAETAAAPKPSETAAPRVTEEHPSSAAVHEAEQASARTPGAVPDVSPEIGAAPAEAARVGVGDHELYVRRGPRGVEVGMCSAVCGPLKLKIEEIQARIRESNPELHQRLEELKTRATDLEQRIERGEVPRKVLDENNRIVDSPMLKEVQKLAGELRGMVGDEPSLVAHLNADPDVRAVKGLEGRVGETKRIVADDNWETNLGLTEETDLLYVVRLRNQDNTYEVLKVGQTKYRPGASRNRFDLYKLAGWRLRAAGVFEPGSHIEIEATPVNSLPQGRSIESFEAQLRAQSFEPGKMRWDSTPIEGVNPLLRPGPGTPFEPISSESPLYGKYEWNARGELVPKSGEHTRLARPTDAPSREDMIKLLQASGGSTEKASQMSKEILGRDNPLSASRIRELVAQYKLQHLRAPRGGGPK